MILTAENMFKSFLDGIKKERISTVTPTYFNRIINEACENWYTQKSTEIERDQKRIDDLQGWRVATDGVFKHNGNILPFIPAVNQVNDAAWGKNLFYLPKSATGTGKTIGGVLYPEYRRLLNVMFRLKYYGNPCYTDGTLSDWKSGEIMRSNQRPVLERNIYRRPSESMNVYYEIVGDMIRIDVRNAIGYDMRLEYIKYPVDIAYVSGGTSVNSELSSDQQREIVDIAVRMYIERTANPRYQTQIYENAQKSSGK